MSASAYRVKEILAVMRERLISGVYPRGSRLPVRGVLHSEFKTSPAAMQEVINTLGLDGQIVSRGKLGTFVVDHPPCLDRFAWLYPESAWPYRRRVLHSLMRSIALQTNEEGSDHSFVWHYGMARNLNWNPAHQTDRLIEGVINDISNRRIAGLIFPVGAFGPWVKDFLRAWPGMPHVRFEYSLEREHSPNRNNPAISISIRAFAHHALDHLVKRGIKTVGLWYCGRIGKHVMNMWDEEIAARGLTSNPLWCISLGEDSSSMQAECILQLMRACPLGLPEAFIILDDINGASVTTAIYNLRIKVPSELLVVMHSHFSGASNPFVPVVEIGYKPTDIVNACVELLRHQQATPGSTPVIDVPISVPAIE